MRKYAKLISCVLALGLLLWACAGEPEPVEQFQLAASGGNWLIFINEDLSMGVLVRDRAGNEIYRRQYISHEPQFSNANISSGLNWMKMDMYAGANAMDTRFFDLEQGIYSPIYRNVITEDFGLVLHNEWTCGEWPPTGEHMLVVNDMLDAQLRRTVLELDFWQFDGEELSIEIQDQLLPGTRFRMAEFVSSTQLYVEYLNVDAEFISQMIEIA